MRIALSLVCVLGCGAARPVEEPAVQAPAQTMATAPRLSHHARARLAAAHEPSRLDEVARVAAASASARFVVSASELKAAMARALGSGVWPHVLTGWGEEAEIAAQLEAGLAELRTAIEIAEIGYATASGSAGRVGVIVAVAAPQLPLTVERRGDIAQITVAWRWGDAAAVYAVTPTASRRLDTTVIGDELALAVDCADPVAIEIRTGARVLATVLDACAPELATDELPPAIDIGPPARTPIEFEMRLWALANRARVAHGLAALAWSGECHGFARQHAAEMARFRYVGHQSPGGGSFEARVSSAPFPSPRSMRENVGHAWGPGEMHEGFMQSVGHRGNLMAGDVVQGAIGAVVDPDDRAAFYVTELFRRP